MEDTTPINDLDSSSLIRTERRWLRELSAFAQGTRSRMSTPPGETKKLGVFEVGFFWKNQLLQLSFKVACFIGRFLSRGLINVQLFAVPSGRLCCWERGDFAVHAATIHLVYNHCLHSFVDLRRCDKWSRYNMLLYFIHFK